ncbi:MAG: hypothetical protein QM770_06080 [Tepidisphaeraceae bacterium]
MTHRAKDIFLDALDHPPGEQRDAFVRASCAGDIDLLKSVQNLLATHDALDEKFLNKPLSGPRGLVPAVTAILAKYQRPSPH